MDKSDATALLIEKHKDKGKLLLQKYEVLRGSKHCLACKFRRNLDEEVEVVEEEPVVETPPEEKGKKKK